MHRNFFLFKGQVNAVNREVQGALIRRCFTYRRHELVLHYEHHSSGFIRIGLQSSTPYLLLDPVRNIKEPSFDFFEGLLDDKIEKLSITDFDKLVKIECTKYRLICKFYGSHPNVYLTDKGGSIEASFKKPAGDEDLYKPPAGDKPLPDSEIYNVDPHHSDLSVLLFFTKKIGGFNSTLSRELLYRAQLDITTGMHDLSKTKWQALVHTYQAIINEINEGKALLYEHPRLPPVLSLIILKHLPAGYQKKEFENINRAWKQFLYIHLQINELQRHLQKNLSIIKRRIDYLQSSLKKISQFDQLEEKKKRSELKGHLLQTYAAEIAAGTETVRLKNVFSEEGELIEIRLNPALTLQENAQKYFEKYKHIDTLKSDLAAKRNTYDHELKYWQEILGQAEEIDSLRKAEKLTDLLVAKNLIQAGTGKEPQRTVHNFSFNHLLLEKKWEILIGKNAKNNDLLTFKYAHKYDIWLHAQGVPGSHVIIHLKDKNQLPPAEIIQKAASIAAYFSSAKTSGIVPVNYTTVRYVRKPRNAPAGTVTLSHEKTLFVEPKKYL